MTVPTYDQLPMLPDTSEAYSWDVWGRDDQLGTLNFIGPEQIRHAGSLVEAGEVHCLSLPLGEPNPGLFPERKPYERHEVRTDTGRDDHIDGVHLQFSSQWDALRHIEHRRAGYYGGRTDDDIGTSLGIDQVAKRGVIGRGVLLDLPRHLERNGIEHRPDVRREISPDDLDEIASAQGVGFRAGDVLLVRTGWVGWYSQLDVARRQTLLGSVGRQPDPLACAGLAAGRDTARWLWDHRIAAVATDNPAVEVLPVQRPDGFLHRRLIPLLGMLLGELWMLDGLAERCAELRRYEFLLTSAPLRIEAGVGSPANALAVL